MLQPSAHTPEPLDAAIPLALRLVVEKALEKDSGGALPVDARLVVDLTRVQRHSSANTNSGAPARTALEAVATAIAGRLRLHDNQVGSGRHAFGWAAGIAAGVVVILLGFVVVPRFLGPTTRTPAASFVLLPPEGKLTSFGGEAIDRVYTALSPFSPDGERLAFVATDRLQNHPDALGARPSLARTSIFSEEPTELGNRSGRPMAPSSGSSPTAS